MELNDSAFRFEAGIGQRFVLPEAHQMDLQMIRQGLASMPMGEIGGQHDVEAGIQMLGSTKASDKGGSKTGATDTAYGKNGPQTFPLVVSLVSQSDEESEMSSNVTMFDIENTNTGMLCVKVQHQIAMIRGVPFMLLDVFGLSEESTCEGTLEPPPRDEVVTHERSEIEGALETNDGRVADEESGLARWDTTVSTTGLKGTEQKPDAIDAANDVRDVSSSETLFGASDECAICMSSERNTITLPCRHLCLCKGCADVLKNQSSKCPICRQVYTSLLHIEIKNM
jgi:hypothetical protein